MKGKAILTEQDKPIAIVLGGTLPHKFLVKKLKARGYYVILIDYCEWTPATDVADEHIQESTLDKEAVLGIVRSYNASLVISSCIDQANVTCCYVSEQLGLPLPYNYKTALDVTDKGRMKTLFAEGGIPTSAFQVFDAVEKVDSDAFVYPVVVKPVDSNSSKGVHRVDKPAELEKYVNVAMQASRVGRIIIEGFCRGYEIQVDCLAIQSKANVLMTRKKQRLSERVEDVLQSHGSVVPAQLTDGELIKVEILAQQICDTFELCNTPFFYQAMVFEGEIYVFEFAPRIGGSLSFDLIEKGTGVDILEASIDSFLGEPIVFPEMIQNGFLATHLLYMKPGVFDHFEGLEKIISNGMVESFYQFKKAGAPIGEEKSSGNRIGAFIVKAETKEEMAKKIDEARGQIAAFNAEGNSCLLD